MDINLSRLQHVLVVYLYVFLISYKHKILLDYNILLDHNIILPIFIPTMFIYVCRHKVKNYLFFLIS